MAAGGSSEGLDLGRSPLTAGAKGIERRMMAPAGSSGLTPGTGASVGVEAGAGVEAGVDAGDAAEDEPPGAAARKGLGTATARGGRTGATISAASRRWRRFTSEPEQSARA